jgi:hypothetical protein
MLAVAVSKPAREAGFFSGGAALRNLTVVEGLAVITSTKVGQPVEEPGQAGTAHRLTPKMVEAGLRELCLWHDPTTPICEVSSQALEAAYNAMVRISRLASQDARRAA